MVRNSGTPCIEIIEHGQIWNRAFTYYFLVADFLSIKSDHRFSEAFYCQISYHLLSASGHWRRISILTSLEQPLTSKLSLNAMEEVRLVDRRRSLRSKFFRAAGLKYELAILRYRNWTKTLERHHAYSIFGHAVWQNPCNLIPEMRLFANV